MFLHPICIRIIEVKTGSADISIRQSEISPQIKNGNSIPRGKVAESFGLKSGMPLKEQGYPNVIPIEIMNLLVPNNQRTTLSMLLSQESKYPAGIIWKNLCKY